MKKYIAEVTGTFALVFCGTGAIIIDQVSGGAISHAGVSVTFGLIVLAMIYALGDLSGAHLNPAVSLGFVLAKRFKISEALKYIIAQLLGGLLASIVLKFMFPTSEYLGATIPAGAESQSFVLEIILTFILMLVILRVSTGAREKGITAGIAIGAVVGLEAMFAGPISGASMNPVRSFAPAIVSGHLNAVWIYLLAPLIGAFLAVVLDKYLSTNLKFENN